MAKSQNMHPTPGKGLPSAYRDGVPVKLPSTAKNAGQSQSRNGRNMEKMKMANLDADRGYTMRASFLQPDKRVFMYKDTPGVYFDVHGAQVSEAEAHDAGFPTEQLARLKHISEARVAAEAEWKKAYAEVLGQPKNVVASRGGFSVVELANDNFDIEDIDGTRLNRNPMTFAEAERLFGLLAPLPQDVEGQSDE